MTNVIIDHKLLPFHHLHNENQHQLKRATSFSTDYANQCHSEKHKNFLVQKNWISVLMKVNFASYISSDISKDNATDNLSEWYTWQTSGQSKQLTDQVWKSKILGNKAAVNKNTWVTGAVKFMLEKVRGNWNFINAVTPNLHWSCIFRLIVSLLQFPSLLKYEIIH